MDCKKKGRREDFRLIIIDDDYATLYWTTELGVSTTKLKTAVIAVGSNVREVKKYLRMPCQ